MKKEARSPQGWRPRFVAFLGPPDPFLKMLMGMASAVVSTYLFVLPSLEATWTSLLRRFLDLIILGPAVSLVALFVLWAFLDYALQGRSIAAMEGFKGIVVGILGYLVFESLHQLALIPGHRGTFLATYATTLVGMVIALAVETRNRRSRRVHAKR